MSIHRDCGATITWMKKRDEDGWMPPFEYAGEGFWADEEGVGHHAHFYQPHVCDPEVVATWMARLERLAEVTGDSGELDATLIRQAKNEREQESARAAAEKYTCETCHADIGHPCISRAKGVDSAGKPTKWPHQDRLAKTNWYEQRD